MTEVPENTAVLGLRWSLLSVHHAAALEFIVSPPCAFSSIEMVHGHGQKETSRQ